MLKKILNLSQVVFPLYFLVFTLSVGRIYRSPGLVGASSVWYSTTNNIHVLTHHPASTQKHAKDIQRGRAHRQTMCLHNTPANTQKHTKDNGLREGNTGVLRGGVCTVASKSLGSSVLYGEDGTTD